jgi:hypothetical protein
MWQFGLYVSELQLIINKARMHSWTCRGTSYENWKGFAQFERINMDRVLFVFS